MFAAFSKTSYGSQYFLVLGFVVTAFAVTRFKEQRESSSQILSGRSGAAGA
jgi:uncharacterized membrane protein